MNLEFIKDNTISNIEKRKRLVDIKYIYKNLLNIVKIDLQINNYIIR